MGKKLTRSTEDKWIAGVCGGVAEYTGMDANLVRLLVVAATLLGLGSLLLVYVAAWVLMPVQGSPDGPTTGHGPPPPSA